MKILIPTTILPAQGLTVNAAPVVLRELVREISSLGHNLAVLPVFFEQDSVDFSDGIDRAMEELKSSGVNFLSPIVLPYRPFDGGRYTKNFSAALIKELLLTPNFFLYPVLRNCDQIYAYLDQQDFDVLLSVWSEPLAMLLAGYPSPKVAYYGNPDPKSFRANLNFLRRQGGKLSRYLFGRAVLAMLEKTHLTLMKQWDVVANVAANDALYYGLAGHQRSVYVPNTWVMPQLAEGSLRRTMPESSPFKIVASIGKQHGTANSLGFEYLLESLLPELRLALKDLEFELHVFGSGEPHRALAPLWTEPEVIRRGFVDDLDSEIAGSHAFLILNNATEFNVCHTRYVYAWTVGSCLVGHDNVTKSMPEFRNGENALLGKNAREIAGLLRLAYLDQNLAAKVAAGGRRTYEEFFTPRAVATQLDKLIREI